MHTALVCVCYMMKMQEGFLSHTGGGINVSWCVSGCVCVFVCMGEWVGVSMGVVCVCVWVRYVGVYGCVCVYVWVSVCVYGCEWVSVWVCVGGFLMNFPICILI